MRRSQEHVASSAGAGAFLGREVCCNILNNFLLKTKEIYGKFLKPADIQVDV
jgi:hypothetical protein